MARSVEAIGTQWLRKLGRKLGDDGARIWCIRQPIPQRTVDTLGSAFNPGNRQPLGVHVVEIRIAQQCADIRGVNLGGKQPPGNPLHRERQMADGTQLRLDVQIVDGTFRPHDILILLQLACDFIILRTLELRSKVFHKFV